LLVAAGADTALMLDLKGGRSRGAASATQQ
jgi:hypothetical protein